MQESLQGGRGGMAGSCKNVLWDRKLLSPIRAVWGGKDVKELTYEEQDNHKV